MKEVTYEEWQKNPTPRMMWVWDSIENAKEQRKVIYISELGITYPIFALTDDKLNTEHFKHCAEIEEPKTRRYTNQELAWWLLDGLKEGKHREWAFNENNPRIHIVFEYYDNEASYPVRSDIQVREDGGEWKEPLVEVEE